VPGVLGEAEAAKPALSARRQAVACRAAIISLTPLCFGIGLKSTKVAAMHGSNAPAWCLQGSVTGGAFYFSGGAPAKPSLAPPDSPCPATPSQAEAFVHEELSSLPAKAPGVECRTVAEGSGGSAETGPKRVTR